MSVRAGLSLVAGCVSAVLLYALLRTAQKLIFPEPDPALVLYSEHAGYVWRAWTSGYVGGMAALLTWLLAAQPRASDRVARLLLTALPVAALLLAAQGVLLP